MDAFVTAALLGTAQVWATARLVDTTHIETGTAVDTLTAKLSGAQEKERDGWKDLYRACQEVL